MNLDMRRKKDVIKTSKFLLPRWRSCDTISRGVRRVWSLQDLYMYGAPVAI